MADKACIPEPSVEERVDKVTPLPQLLDDLNKVREHYAEMSSRLNHLLYRLTGNEVEISSMLYDKREILLEDLMGQIDCFDHQGQQATRIINLLDEAI